MSRKKLPDAPPDDDRQPSLRDTLDAVRSMDGPGVTTADISVILGCSTDTARRRLEELFEDGYVNRRKTGQQTIWWEVDREARDERGAAKRLDPVDGPDTDAVTLIEAGDDE